MIYDLYVYEAQLEWARIERAKSRARRKAELETERESWLSSGPQGAD